MGRVWGSYESLKKIRTGAGKSASPACSTRLLDPEGPGDLFERIFLISTMKWLPGCRRKRRHSASSSLN